MVPAFYFEKQAHRCAATGAGSDAQINIEREADAGGAGGGKHSEEEILAAPMMVLGGDVVLAHLQFVDAGDGLVQARLAVVTAGAVAEPRGAEAAKHGFVAFHQLVVEPVGILVNGLGGIVKSVRGVFGIRERGGQSRRFHVRQLLCNDGFVLGIFQDRKRPSTPARKKSPGT